MESGDYDNPSEDINERLYEETDNISFFLKEYLHKELCNTNQGAYCLIHHSIETRATKKHHQGCILYGAKELKGISH